MSNTPTEDKVMTMTSPCTLQNDKKPLPRMMHACLMSISIVLIAGIFMDSPIKSKVEASKIAILQNYYSYVTPRGVTD